MALLPVDQGLVPVEDDAGLLDALETIVENPGAVVVVCEDDNGWPELDGEFDGSDICVFNTVVGSEVLVEKNSPLVSVMLVKTELLEF